MRLAGLCAIFVLLCFSASCSSGGGASETPPPPGDAQQFDPNLLSSVVLLPEDLGPDYPYYEQAFNPGIGATTSFARWYRANGVTITSSIVQYNDAKARTAGLDPLRRRFEKLIGPEGTFRLSGADTAFAYQGAGPPSAASLVVRGRYVASVLIQASNDAPIASDRATLERFSGLLLDRLQALLADPSVITPAADAPTFVVPRPETTPAP